MDLFKAIGLKLVSALLFAAMSALVRQLGDVAPVGQMVFFRSAFAILPVVVLYALRVAPYHGCPCRCRAEGARAYLPVDGGGDRLHRRCCHAGSALRFRLLRG